MLTAIRKAALVCAALAAFGLGGAALASAADNGSSGSTTTTDSRPARPQRQALSSEVAAKVEAAALAKVPGATVLRTEAGGPYDSAYHAHVRTSGGTLQVVLVNGEFEANAVEALRSRGHGGRGGPGGGETPLTGDTKRKVEAAVLANTPALRSFAPRRTATRGRRTSRTSAPPRGPSSRCASARASRWSRHASIRLAPDPSLRPVPLAKRDGPPYLLLYLDAGRCVRQDVSAVARLRCDTPPLSGCLSRAGCERVASPVLPRPTARRVGPANRRSHPVGRVRRRAGSGAAR